MPFPCRNVYHVGRPADEARQQAGAASAVSETAYELGTALGIALLGSVVTGFYSGIAAPSGVPAAAADQARQSLAGAVEAAGTLPADLGQALLTAAREAFTSGLRVASGVGAAVLLLAALWAWRGLRGQRLEDHPGE